MLLTCCFKEQKKPKKSRDLDHGVGDHGDFYGPASKAEVKAKTKAKLRNEKAPLKKEEKRLKKQRSIEKFHEKVEGQQNSRKSSNVTTTNDHIDNTRCDEDHKTVIKAPSSVRVSQTETAPLLIQKSVQPPKSRPSSLQSNSSRPLSKDQEIAVCTTPTQTDYDDKPIIVPYKSPVVTSANEATIRTSAELTRHFEVELNSLRRQHQKQLIERDRQHESALRELKTAHQLEIAKLSQVRDPSQRASAVEVLELQKRIEVLKTTHEAEIQAYREREIEWQQEKEEVLQEIQRLKEEANRFIAILSAQDDEDDESLSPQKKQTLKREVESLQLVVEMRTQEVHRLRNDIAKYKSQLEDFELTEAELKKAKAKVEDLEALLQQKNELERQLSLEMTNLEHCAEDEAKRRDQISKQMEELQWKIRHKMELPVSQFGTSPHNFHHALPADWQRNRSVEEEEVVLQRSSVALSSQNGDVFKTHGISKPQLIPLQKEQGRDSLSPEASPNDGDKEDNPKQGGALNGRMSSDSLDKHEDENETSNEKDIAAVSNSEERNSKLMTASQFSEINDEGLGDISSSSSSSTSEKSPSPQPEDDEVRSNPKPEESPRSKNNPYSGDERMPSRIALPAVPTKL